MRDHLSLQGHEWPLQGEGYMKISLNTKCLPNSLVSKKSFHPNQFPPGARCYLLLGLKQGYPLHSPQGCRHGWHGYHPLGAWLEEQNALTSQILTKQRRLSALLKGTSVLTRYWTHTLLLTAPELGSARPWHAMLHIISYIVAVPAAKT